MRWILLGLILAIGVAFLLLQPGPSPVELKGADSDLTSSTPPPLPPAIEDPPARTLSPGLPGPTQEEEDLLALIPRESSLRVLVVDKAGAPLPGAEVFWRVRSRGAAALHPTPVPPFLSPEEEAFSTGHGLVADAEGSVSIPRLPWRVFVAGRHGDLIGKAEFSPDQESPARLELGKARTIEILVVDDHGEPCPDVPVSILWGRSEGARRQAIMDRMGVWDRPPRVIALWKGRTREPDGIAVARFLPDWIGEGQTDEDIVAAFQVPITGGQPAPVDPKAAGPVRLVLPPMGRILVKLLDADGMPLSCRAEVILCPTEATDILGPDEGFPWYVRIQAENGLAVYPYVGIGQRIWAVGAHALDPWVKFEHMFMTFPGPTAANEKTEVVLRTKEHPGPYKGRMVDEAGLPRAGVLVSVWVDQFGQYGEQVNPSAILFQTGRDGRFGFQAKVSAEFIGLGFRFTEWQHTGPSGEPLGPWAYVIKERPFPPEGIDLGDVALLNDIPAVSGLVIDHSGKPVDKAFVRLCRAPGRVGPKGETGYFAHDTWTDANGRFLIAVHDPGPFSLSASATGAKSDQLHFVAAGTHDVELRLHPVAQKPQDHGEIELELLVDPGVPVDGLEVDCGNKEYGFQSMREVDAGQEECVLRSSKLKPGTYTVLVKGGGATLAEVDGIKVESGVISKDPRLSPLDLRGRLRFGLLQVETSDRAYVDNLICALECPGTEVGVSTCRLSAAGTFKILVPASCTSVIVGAKGYKWISVPVSSEIRKVVLRPGPRVRIRQVPADIIEPYTPGLFGISGLVLSWQRISTTSSKVEQAVVARTGGDSGIRLDGEDLLLNLPAPGAYRFTLNCQLTGPDTKICAKPPLPRSSPGEIEIMDRDGEQNIDLKIDPAEILETRRKFAEGAPRLEPSKKP